jgi:hypothetical protein
MDEEGKRVVWNLTGTIVQSQALKTCVKKMILVKKRDASAPVISLTV